MAWIKATDIAYGRLRSPDLDLMEEFLTRFGMVRAERTHRALHARHRSRPPHPCHREGRRRNSSASPITRRARTTLSARQGARRIGGRDDRRARRRQARAADRAERLPDRGRARHRGGWRRSPTKRQKLNTGEEPLSRAGELMRLPKGPSHVKRIGHGVLMTPKFHETVDWFRETLGLHLLGRRLCRRQEEPDRLVQSLRPRRRLTSITTCSSASRTRRPASTTCRSRCRTSTTSPWATTTWRSSAPTSTCGGSAGTCSAARSTTTGPIPWGRVHEHWADSDRLNLANGSNLVPAEEALISQWGEAPPAKFINHASP